MTDFKVIRDWVLARDGYTCHYCAASAYEVDHLWPRRLGGGDHINNLVAACRKCNSSKGATVDLSATRPDLLQRGLTTLISRLKSEIDEVERWSRAYVDCWERHDGSGVEIFSLAMEIGDPLIELKALKESLQRYASDRMEKERAS